MEKTIIKKVRTNSGFLQNCPVEFSPGVNCIIGARGTCKTTLVESIRFAFDFEPDQVTALTSQGGLIRASLKAGTVMCEMERTAGSNKSVLLIERDLDSMPRVFRDGVREYANAGEVLHEIEIYSSGELQEIADDAGQKLRLSLVDRPNRAIVMALQSERQEIIGRIRNYGPELRTIRADLAQKRTEVKNLSGLRDQLEQTRSERPQLSNELEEAHTAFQRRRSMLSEVAKAVEAQDLLINALELAAQFALRFSQLNAALQIHPEAKPIVSLLDAMHSSSMRARHLASEVRGANLREEQANLQREFEGANTHYNQLRQEQQAINESLKREDVLRRQIEHLEAIQEQVLALEKKEADILSLRRDARGRVSAITDEIYRLRSREVEAINSENADSVVLTLRPGEQTDEYVVRLSELLSGSRIRGQEDLAQQLALQFRPSDLIDLLETGDPAVFADALDRDVGQMTRIVAFLRDQPDLYDLEAQTFEDKLEITMYDHGQPKPVETLSKGQRATALLILRPSPTR
jgi:uncharacterized coiled-coil DUF342 family protein